MNQMVLAPLALAAVLLVGCGVGDSGEVASAQTDAELSTPYRHLIEERYSAIGGPFSETVTARVETWASETQLYRSGATTEVGFETAEDRASWIERGRPSSEAREMLASQPDETLVDRSSNVICRSGPFRPNPFCRKQPARAALEFAALELPSDPAALEAAIEARAAKDPGEFNEEVFFTALEQLTNPLASAALRVSLLETMKGVDGAVSEEQASDRRGREALLVTFETQPISFSRPGRRPVAEAQRWQIYADPQTAAALEVRSSIVSEGAPPKLRTYHLYGQREAAEGLPAAAVPLLRALEDSVAGQ